MSLILKHEMMMVTYLHSVFIALHQMYVLQTLWYGIGANGGTRMANAAEIVMVSCIGWREPSLSRRDTEADYLGE